MQRHADPPEQSQKAEHAYPITDPRVNSLTGERHHFIDQVGSSEHRCSIENPPRWIDEGATAKKRFFRGDSNLDEVIDLADPVLIRLFLFQAGEPLVCDPLMDANTKSYH